MIFGQYNPSVSPNAGQPFLVFSVRRKMIVVDVNGCPCLAESRGNSFLPKGRSRKKTGGSGGFEGEFAPDRFFDFKPREAIVVCQIIH